MEHISLSGRWDFRLDDEAEWRSIAVPGCWEQIGVRKDIAGPAWYRTSFDIPPEFAGKRLWLHFDAVSYHCEIFLNGRAIGSHTGLWDAFEIEISGLACAGTTAELALRIEKPAGLTRGPDSATLPGRFPLRETLVGFLPYVWGHIFGGIWQDVALITTGAIMIEDLAVRGTADGRVLVDAILSAPATASLEIRDPDGRSVFSATEGTEHKEHQTASLSVDSVPSVPSVAKNAARFEITIPSPRPWSPHDPALYEARLRIADGDQRVVRFGLRSLRTDGTTIRLNERPIYPRMALSWGWYPAALNSNPAPARVRADFARLKQLGYNGVKLCLWFPPQYYFDLADELGMLLWVELPMWIPQPSPFFRAQTPIEYARLMRQARNHPSVILYSLGCELNRAIDAELLAPLFAMVKAHAGDALVRDNSGSGEAYGGLLNEFAEYYDYHFYSELQFFRGLLDHFTPRWRPVQPWVFGEFCDYETFRDPNRLPIADCRLQIDDPNLQLPWWMLDDPNINPQGARWMYEVVAHEQRLRANGMAERGDELRRISERQGLLHRKYTLELARLYREISGYVVTGEADTPISTAGMWDASDRLKFDPPAFRAFNADLVLLAGWDRRRTWAGGGDRPALSDTWSYPAGTTVRAHLVASHYGQSSGSARVSWAVALADQPPFAAGAIETSFDLTPGDLRELAIAEFATPNVDRPHAITLSAAVRVGDEQAENAWTLWIFPRDIWRAMRDVTLLDPSGRLHDFPQIAPGLERDKETRRQADTLPPCLPIVIATAWTPELQAFVTQGGRAVLLQSGVAAPGPLPAIEMPFWREAIRLAAPHPAWRDFPLDETMGMQFFGCATDYALDLSAFEQPWSPIFRRLDARTLRLHEYAVELHLGNGRLIITTLRYEGGQGAQPLGIARNTSAAYLLWCWVSYLQEQRS